MTVPETLKAYRACGYRLRLSQNGKVFASPQASLELRAFIRKNHNDVVELLREEREHIERERLIALIAELGAEAPAPTPSAASADAHEVPCTLPLSLG